MTTDTNLELLELAAKAARIEYHIDTLDGCEKMVSNGAIWNPLFDDAQSLRLAVKLGIFNTRSKGYGWPDHDMFIRDNDNPYAATRRAIVRAAAEIGRAMP